MQGQAVMYGLDNIMINTAMLECIKKEFNLPAPLEIIQPVTSGDAHTVYLAVCGRANYVIKKINKKRYVQDYGVEINKLKQSLRFGEEIATQISATGHAISACSTQSGFILEADDDLILLYPYVDAVVLGPCAISPAQVKEIAGFLYHLHHSQIQFDHTFAEEKFEIFKEIGRKILALSLWQKLASITHKRLFFPKINQITHYLISHKAVLLESLEKIKEKRLCHNDLRPKNVLWNKGNFWVSDWESAGLFDQTCDYLESLLAWCTVNKKSQIIIEPHKLEAFMEVYSLPQSQPLQQAINILLIKWYFWLAFCLKNLVNKPKKFKSTLANIRYAIQFIIFLINDVGPELQKFMIKKETDF